MSIDGIGKKAGVPLSTPEATGPSTKTKVGIAGDAFALKGAQSAEAAAPANMFDEVRAGRTSIDTYLDQKVQHATRGLEGLAPNELAFIQKSLRSELAEDPALSDLVRQATGSIPKVPEE
jgi:hypothetical protein